MTPNQHLINIALGMLWACVGWWLKIIHQSLRDLHKEDKDIKEKVSEMQVLVAGNYITRCEMDKKLSEVTTRLDVNSTKLDRIEGKIERRSGG